MKKIASKTILLTTLLALAGIFATPAALAQSGDSMKREKTEKKAKRDAEVLKKYDKNANGKLDAGEEAAMKADQEKLKAEKKEKQEKKSD